MIEKLNTLTKLEKLKLLGLCIKSATAIVGGSLILSETYPFTSLSVLALGGVANEVVSFVKEKEHKLEKEEIALNNNLITKTNEKSKRQTN